MNRKAEILYRLGEPLAAGMFEHENSSVVERFGLGLRRSTTEQIGRAHV